MTVSCRNHFSIRFLAQTMAAKPVPISTIYSCLLLCTCVVAPFLNATLCRLVSSVLIIRFLMFAIQAAVTSGPRRTFAFGFLISAVTYLTGVWLADEFQLRHERDARLPTTALLTSLKEAPEPFYDSPRSSREAQMRRAAHENGAAFMILGQLLFTLIFGILGGKYANHLTAVSVPASSDESRH